MTKFLFTKKDFNAWETEKQNLLVKLQESQTEVENLKNMSKDMTETQAAHNETVNTLKAEHETNVNTLKADYEKQISDLKELVTIEAGSSESKAIKTLAQIGVPADELPKANVITEDVVAKYESLSGAARVAYFGQNKDAILKAYKQKKG